MSELEKLLQAIEQEVEDGELPRGYLADVERVREEQAAQQSVHPTVLPAREIEIICPNCNLVIDVPVPASHSG